MTDNTPPRQTPFGSPITEQAQNRQGRYVPALEMTSSRPDGSAKRPHDDCPDLLSPESAAFITRAVIQLQSEDGFSAGPTDKTVFLVKRVLPCPEYAVLPGEGPDGWCMAAECLYACGHMEVDVLELWNTEAEAQKRCDEIVAELGDDLCHVILVQPMLIGCHVQWHPANAD